MATETVEIDSTYRTRLADRGDGPPTVLIHGTPLDSGTWDPLELPGRRLLAYDLRAHGSAADSPPATSYDQLAADLATLMDRLGIEAAEIVGHSFGGQVAMAFAARFPERVRHLWVVCCRASPFPPFAAAAERIEAEGIAPAAAAALERWFTPAERDPETPAVAYARAHLTDSHAAAFAAAMRLIAPFDLPAPLRPSPFPSTFIAAERDEVATPEDMEKGAGLCAGRFRLAPGHGHMLPLQDPALLARLMAD
jgi:3-oxoadipate enol-lactonase